MVLPLAKRILLPVAALLAVMIGLGELATRTLKDENGLNRLLAAHRNGFGDAVSWFFSLVGSTPAIVAVTAIVAMLILWHTRRWRAPVYLCAAVSAQALVFLFTTLAIDRERPAVAHLDNSPPTSSFPSGHTSAAFALYCGLGFLLLKEYRRTWAIALILVPIGVAVARLYRGMHHPSDVTASFLNGAACIAIMWNALMRAPDRRSSPSHPSPAATREHSGTPRRIVRRPPDRRTLPDSR